MSEPQTEGRTEREAARIERVRQRLTFSIEAAGLRLHVDGTPYRILIEKPQRKRDLPPLVPLLEQARDFGAAHGRCNTQAEIADLLLNRDTPGHVLYDLKPDRSITMHRDGAETTLPIPDGLKPFYIVGQTVRALDAVFEIAGQLADEDADLLPRQDD